jgi:NAD+ kinase
MTPEPARRPNGPIRRVGIVGKTRLQGAASHIRDIATWLDGRRIEAALDADTATLASLSDRPTYSKDDLPCHVDMVLVLGGDGTLLGMADRIAHAGTGIPILGVNFGSLGFLTEITLPELYPSLESALEGTAGIDERLMLRSAVVRRGALFAERIVLNDVVITKGAFSRIIDLSVWVGSEFVTRVRADGLIVASPTGSTAYNLAAGGPIIEPAVAALVLTPIAPHTLSNRPVVIPASAAVRVQPVVDNNAEIYVTFDGQWGFPLERDDVVTVARAPEPLRLFRASARSYYEVLRQKLKWGGL